MSEQVAPANGIEIAYDTFGDPAHPALLLVMGLGMQMIAWDPALCRALAERGFHVIRFDNRDVGLSTKIEDGPKANVLAAWRGKTGSASYTLDHMADDAFGLLDHLEVEAAHVVGASLGGMIAQTMAIRRPERVLSLTSIMSTTGERGLARPRIGVMSVLLRKAPRERAAFIEYALRIAKKIGSPAFPADEERLRERAAASFDRSFYPYGSPRQLVAIAASGDRTAKLRDLTVPTVVIHGDKDRLVPHEGGRATAAAVPGAELVTIPGMGHDLPPAVWPEIIDAIAANAARSRSALGSRP